MEGLLVADRGDRQQNSAFSIDLESVVLGAAAQGVQLAEGVPGGVGRMGEV